MDREASLLRCSKLSCYAEFNRMVQAIARNGKEVAAIPAARSMHGTSAEYCFYTTLVMMLRQIVSNPDPAAQQRELQCVYQWFSVNKPLMSTKTKPSHRKPTLSLTSSSRLSTPCQTPRLISSCRPSGSSLIVDCERPQTAPASLYELHPPSRHHHPHTPPNHPPQHSFTSTFMTQSLSRELEKVGRGGTRDGRVGVPFEDLQLGMETQVEGISVETSPLHSRASRSSNSRVRRKEARGVLARGGGRGRGDVRESPVSIVSIPTPDSLSGQVSSPALSFGVVFAKVPNIAAKMELDREMREAHKTAFKQSALSSDNYSGSTFQQLTKKDKTRTGLVATEVSTPPGSKGPESPDSNHHCDDVSMERTTLTVGEESGLELKPGGMGVEHISISVAHHDSSPDKGDIMQQPADGRPADGRPADGEEDRSTHKTTDQNMRGVNMEPAGQRSCSQGGHVFLTTTVDSASPEDAEPKASEHAAHQTSTKSEDSEQREPGSHTNDQGPVLHESSEELSISQEADIEATSCSGGELTVESSRFGVIGVSFQSTQSSPSANTGGPKATPSPQKRVATPMNIITITFPSTLEHTNRPQTSFGERRKTSAFVSASGFNRTRYRPITMATSSSNTG